MKFRDRDKARQQQQQQREVTYDDPPEQVHELEELAPVIEAAPEEPLTAQEQLIRSVMSVDSSAVPAPQWYVVRRAGAWPSDGVLHWLAQGSRVCETTHDLGSLRANGIELEACEPPSRPLDAYGEAL